jgi:rhodanese-related sulfurtransferase
MNFPNINSSEFAAAIKEPNVVLLDVRRTDEYAAGHIEHSIHVDVESPSFTDEVAKLDKAKTYAIYCRSGRRSLTAIDLMEKVGFTSFIHLKDGILEWVANKQPVTSS